MWQSRKVLQDLAAQLRSDMCKLEVEYEKEKSSRRKAEQECMELKDLWESEVRSRHKVTAEVSLSLSLSLSTQTIDVLSAADEDWEIEQRIRKSCGQCELHS